MRTAFIEALCEVAANEPRLWLLSGDLGYSVLERFATKFPDRYLNVGVAEQNLTGVAAGLAQAGKIVFTYSIANFPLLRCLEQVRNDVCYQNLDVKIVAVGGGVAYGAAGYTHHAVEDLAIARALPNMTVIAPGDPVETRLATKAIAVRSGPCYLRLGKAQEPCVHQSPPEFSIGRALMVLDGTDATLVSTGGILSVAYEVATELTREGISTGLMSVPTVQPLDELAIRVTAHKGRAIFTVEEHRGRGGLGSAVAEVLAERTGPPVVFKRLYLRDGYLEHAGSQGYLREIGGLSREAIVGEIRQTIRGKVRGGTHDNDE
jgi:transketolase